MRHTLPWLVALGILAAMTNVLQLRSPELARLRHPRPGYSPEQVAGFQLAALKECDRPTPNAGIWSAFQFSSPANRRDTGPYGRFLQLVKGPNYRALLNARSAEIGRAEIAGDQARLRVIGISREGHASRYLVMLSRQTAGAYRGCWMTDAMLPER